MERERGHHSTHHKHSSHKHRRSESEDSQERKHRKEKTHEKKHKSRKRQKRSKSSSSSSSSSNSSSLSHSRSSSSNSLQKEKKEKKKKHEHKEKKNSRKRMRYDEPEKENKKEINISNTNESDKTDNRSFGMMTREEYEAAEVKKEKISKEMYYAKNKNFRVWLEERDLWLDRIESKKQKKMFSEFVRLWNNGSLSTGSYIGRRIRTEKDKQEDDDDGIDGEVPMTKHKWVFKNVDKDELSRVVQEVSTETCSAINNDEQFGYDQIEIENTD